MRKICLLLLCTLCGALMALPARAQTTTSQNPGRAPISSWLRDSYFLTQVYLSRAAQKMPEEYYGMRPGAQTEVRTFGQIVGHLANYNFMECSDVKGEKNPNQGNDFEKVTGKAALVKGLNDALGYCAGVYAALTDASATEMIPVTSQNGGQARALRIGRLIFNYGHNYEHYGNIVTYMRMKGIVPPSSEPNVR